MQGTQGAGAVFGPGLPPPAKRTVIAHWNTVEKDRWSHGVWAQTVVPDVAMQPLLFWLAYPEPLDRMSSSGMMMHWSSP